MTTKFDQAGILCNLKPLTGNVISMDLHPIQSVEFDRSNLTGRMPLTGNVISMPLTGNVIDLHPI